MLKLALRLASSVTLALAAVGLHSGTAQAQTQVALDVEAARTTVPSEETGYGLGLRVGHVWKFLILDLTPEFGASFHEFGGAPDANAYNFMAGGRFGVNFILKPSIFAHAGVGHYAYNAPLFISSTELRSVSNTSLAYDVGVALDFTAIPIIDIGAHATAAGIAGSDTTPNFSWVALGGHVALRFP